MGIKDQTFEIGSFNDFNKVTVYGCQLYFCAAPAHSLNKLSVSIKSLLFGNCVLQWYGHGLQNVHQWF